MEVTCVVLWVNDKLHVTQHYQIITGHHASMLGVRASEQKELRACKVS